MVSMTCWVLFDYGNVISRPQPEREVDRLAQVAGCPVAEFCGAYWRYRLEYDRAQLDGVTYWQKVAAALGRTFSVPQLAELTRLDVLSWLHLEPGTVALIEDVAGSGHRLAMLSNAPTEVAEAITALPVAAHFQRTAFSCFLGSAKPDPATYLAVLELLRASPPEVIFFDDRPENVAGAAALGIRAVLFTTPGEARKALEQYGITTASNGR
jgi:putative hydrolase of the HAD superfamily